MSEGKTLISVNQAAAQGITRVRKPVWSNKFDHLQLDIVDGKPGPWLHLWSPFNKVCNGRDPIDICHLISSFVGSLDAECLEPYTGPLPDSDEYKAAVTDFEEFDKTLESI